jgi:pentatricopeptide repeat protein
MDAVQPNDATLNSLLLAYSILADLQQATNIHCYLVRSGFLSSIEVATGLIDIYSKCGSLESAYKVFSGIPEKGKDIVLWSVIIASYGVHGHGEIAISLFNQMIQSGVKPNEVTFTSVLHACSHAGLVDNGLNLFKFMLENHKMSPCPDHYTCLVDLLGRADRLDEAYDLIRTMPFKPNHAVWGALLGACVIHENVELGEVAAKWLFELEPENTGNYILMAKIYAAVGRWKDAENVRHMMNEIGLRKKVAHSLVEVRNV